MAAQIGSELVLYGAQFRDESVLGATPEWLFKIDQDGTRLRTMALAGTRWQNQARTEEQEAKDRYEHQLVVDDVCARLGDFGALECGKTHWRAAGKGLEHLETPITLHASTRLDAAQMVKLLHPTPAVGVFPRSEEAQRWLWDLPGHEWREDFGAPWLVVNNLDQRAWALVGLRQIRLSETALCIPAGCGVVQGSEEEIEWNEIQQKILSVKRQWGLAPKA